MASLREMILKQDTSNLKVCSYEREGNDMIHAILHIVEIHGKGKGVIVAKTQINQGEFVCEYIGELISHEEAAVREKKYLRVQRKYKGYLFFFKFNEKNLW